MTSPYSWPAAALQSEADTGAGKHRWSAACTAVLNAIARRGPCSAADLSRITGLTPKALAQAVTTLEGAGAVRSRHILDAGRTLLEVGLHCPDQVAVGLDVDRTELTVAVAPLDMSVLAERTIPLPAGHAPELTLPLAAELLDELLREEGIARETLVGAAIGIPAALGIESVLANARNGLPGWRHEDLSQLASDALGMPVLLENDANLDALAQISWGPYSPVNDLVFIEVGDSIGAGILSGGEVLHGFLGAAGELGHLPVVADGELCSCGNRGCLETVATTPRITAALKKAWRRSSTAQTASDIVALAKNRDAATLRALDQAGEGLGAAIAALANILNPEVVIIGGPLAEVGAPLVEPAVRAMGRRTPPVIATRTIVTTNQLGAKSETMGALSLVTQKKVLATFA